MSRLPSLAMLGKNILSSFTPFIFGSIHYHTCEVIQPKNEVFLILYKLPYSGKLSREETFANFEVL